VGDDATYPRDAPKRDVRDVDVLDRPSVDDDVLGQLEQAPTIERPAPSVGRLQRLRARLARANGALGKGLILLLSREHIDEDTWDEVEETLLAADVGVGPTTELIDRLRRQVKADGVKDPEQVRGLLRAELLTLVDPHDGPLAGRAAPRPAPGGGARRRRQRHRQDDHVRQARRGCS
jgi:fused signal recognition particle receptor